MHSTRKTTSQNRIEKMSIVPKSLPGIVLFSVFCILVIVQIVVAVKFETISTSALENMKYATFCYENGSFNINAPYMSILGLICRAVGIHPLIFIHSVSPIVMITLCMGAYVYLFATIYTPAPVKTGEPVTVNAGCGSEDNMPDYYVAVYASAIALCILNIFGYQSELLMPYTLLGGYFTGQCLIVHFLLPIASARIEMYFRKQRTIGKHEDVDNPDDDYLEEWDMKKHKIINARNLAIALGLVTVILLASIVVLNNKINTLYDATVNLQNEITQMKDSQN